jgi:U-box domain-containing protein
MEETFDNKLDFNDDPDFKIFKETLDEREQCIFTYDIMKNPVIFEDGSTYEKEAIEKYFQKQPGEGKKHSPSTGVYVDSNIKIQNRAFKKSDETIDTLESKIKNYISKNRKSLTDLKSELDKSLSKTQQLQEELDKVKQKNTEVTLENNKLNQELGGARIQIDTFQHQNQKLKKKLKDLKAILANGEEVHNEYKGKLEEKDQNIAQLQKQIQSLKSRNDIIQGKKRITKDKMKAQENTIHTLKDYLKAQMPHTAMANATAAYFSKEYFKLKQARYPVRYFFENKLGCHENVFSVIKEQDKVLEQYRIFHENSDLSDPKAIERYIEYFNYGINLESEKRRIFCEQEKSVWNLAEKLKSDMEKLYKFGAVNVFRHDNGEYDFTPSWKQRNGKYYNNKGLLLKQEHLDLTNAILSSTTSMDLDREFENMKQFELDFTPYYRVSPNSLSNHYELYHSHTGHISTFASKYADLKKGIEDAKSYVYQHQCAEKTSNNHIHNMNNMSGGRGG